MSYVTDPQPKRTSVFRWLLFPVLAILFFGTIIMIPQIWLAMGNQVADAPDFFPFTQFAFPIGFLVLAIWWLFFSGVSWVLRLGLPILLVGAGAVAMFFFVRNVEFTSQDFSLRPVFHFHWEPSAEDKLAQHLANAPKKELPPIDTTVGTEDFAQYRGPKFNGIVSHLVLETDWKKSPPVELWRQPCPGGYSGVAVAGNIAVTLQQRGSTEVVVCYDRATGQQRWEFPYEAFWKDVMGNGPRSTPTIHDDRIYTLGAKGHLFCLNAKGEKQWSHNVLEVAKSKNVQWGLSGSPLIVDDLVVVNAGVDPDANAGMALLAFDRKTGEKRWALSSRQASYSSPMLAMLGGERQILMFHGDALVGHNPYTGIELWNIPWVTDFQMNSVQPLVIGDDRVFITSEKANGSAVFRIVQSNEKKWTTEKLWLTKKVGGRFANPVTDGANIYCLHDLAGILTCLDVKDGSVKWRGPSLRPGQLLLVGDILLTTNGDTGDVSLFATGGEDVKELADHRVFGPRGEKTWNTPALAGDQLFVRNQYEIVCLKLTRK